MDFEQNQNARLCDICGERPASVDVTFVAGGERRNGSLCEQCARAALAQQQAAGLGDGPIGPSFPGRPGEPTLRQRTAGRQRSATLALDAAA